MDCIYLVCLAILLYHQREKCQVKFANCRSKVNKLGFSSAKHCTLCDCFAIGVPRNEQSGVLGVHVHLFKGGALRVAAPAA